MCGKCWFGGMEVALSSDRVVGGCEGSVGMMLCF